MSQLFTILSLQVYQVLFPLALILFISKALGVLAKRFGLPQVVAMLLTGIIIGLLAQNVDWISEYFITDDGESGIEFIAEMGVVLILFSAGLGTDLKLVKENGLSAVIITCLDVTLSIVLGAVVSGIFNGWTGDTEIISGTTVSKAWSNVFYGVILSATSVSVTVAALKELGKLKTKIGTAIVSAAILDDIIGVIVLSVVLSLSGSSAASSAITQDPLTSLLENIMNEKASEIMCVVILTLLFFLFIFVLAVVVKKIFNHLENKYQHHRRIPIYGIAFCFFVAFLSQQLFGIADITGAYFAGLILAGRTSTKYVERRTDIALYIIFTPVFFANIGMSTDWQSFASAASSDATFMAFGICYILAAFAGKFFGASAGAKLTGNTLKDSLRCGASMTVRAEVCLVSASKGIAAGLVDSNIQVFLIILIILSSFVVPLILKASYRNDNNDTNSSDDQHNQLIEDHLEVISKVHSNSVEHAEGNI